MKNYFKLIRVKHWLKNVLVFLPLFFSKNLFNPKLILLSFCAFIIFNLISSIVYVINDLNDIDKDRLHPIKKNRPLASGVISTKSAKILIVISSIISLLFILCLFFEVKKIFVILVPIIYLLLNILYSVKLKNIPIIDVVILVSGFLLRVYYGGISICVDVSKWLYLMIIFGSFYLGFGKRRNEIIKNGTSSRKVLQYYSKDFLDKNMYVALTLAIVSYTLWCVDMSTTNELLFWTIPIIMIIFQLYSLNIEGNSHGDPIEVVLSDKILLSLVLIYVIIMLMLVYIV